jgi:CheY-like chemotaxis protein
LPDGPVPGLFTVRRLGQAGRESGSHCSRTGGKVPDQARIRPRKAARGLCAPPSRNFIYEVSQRPEDHIKAKQRDIANTLETILLVDDEDYIRELVGAILSIEGYNVLEAGSGPQALKVSDEHDGRIHLLLTDVVMSPMTGSELVKQIAPRRPDMLILYISGFPDDAIVQYGIHQSRVSFLAKPFTPKALIQKIRTLLDSVPVQV